MGQVGLDDQRRDTAGCGPWSCQTGLSTEGIQGHGLHCSVRERVVDGGYGGTVRRCSSHGVSDSRSG